MKAIFKTGGKQYCVTEGDKIYIELLDKEAKDKVTFNEVLMIDDKIGMPFIKGASVEAEVIKNGRGKKIKVFHYRPKKKFRKTQGHRQPYTLVEIKKING
ncbi:MAG: 50S ribosomal protein L21 [Mollicutes bacterium]|nr:50S ribosomal protein L21 [Mollicutes bacterium]